MELSRRSFLKASGAGLGSLFMLGAFSDNAVMARSLKERPLKKQVGESPTICPFDGSGCGFIVATKDGRVENIEGDPDHPINRGGGCAKGASLTQLHNDEIGKINPRRLTKPLYRAPGAADWEEKPWDFVLDRIAQLIKKTRDENWISTNTAGTPVNRTEAIGSVGASALDNEECYLLSKMLRALGLVYIEHHARI